MTRLAVAATIADLALLLVALAVFGSVAEQNGLVRAALVNGGLALIVAAKVLIVTVLVLWDRAVGRYRLAVTMTGLAVGVAGATSWLWA